MARKKSRPDKAKRPAVQRYTGPKKTTFDPYSKTEVAVLSDDKGTPEFLDRVVDSLLEFAEPGDFASPLKEVEVYFADRNYKASVRRDHIDQLFDKGHLSKAAYCAARELRAAWLNSMDVRCGSINPNRTGNGRVDDAAIIDRMIAANKKFCAMMRHVKGGPNSYDGLFVSWFCCHAQSLRWIAKTYHVRKTDIPKRLKDALEDIARGYLKPSRIKAQGMRTDELKMPSSSDLEIVC